MIPKPCQCAGPGCFREAVLVARLAGVGDRPLSRECFDTYVAMGMAIRELPADAFVPLWRQKSLARDQTGRLGLGARIRGAA
jgi:hypothetical protein